MFATERANLDAESKPSVPPIVDDEPVPSRDIFVNPLFYFCHTSWRPYVRRPHPPCAMRPEKAYAPGPLLLIGIFVGSHRFGLVEVPASVSNPPCRTPGISISASNASAAFRPHGRPSTRKAQSHPIPAFAAARSARYPSRSAKTSMLARIQQCPASTNRRRGKPGCSLLPSSRPWRSAVSSTI